MEFYEQLTSPELSNKLHQLGVTTPSVFWRDYTGSKPDEIEWAENFEPYYCEDNVNCYTVAELGEMLPDAFQSGKRPGAQQYPERERFECYPYAPMHGKNIPTCIADTEADARAKMLIYLLENKLI